MKIAVISDTHDAEKRTIKLVKLMNREIKPDALIHCGDLCSSFILDALNDLKCPVYICFGYQDVGAALALSEKKGPKVHLFDRLGEIKEEKIAFTHTPVFAHGLACTGNYKAVFYGHTHEAKVEKVGECWLVNPGEIMGRKNKPSYAIYDTKTNKVEIKEL